MPGPVWVESGYCSKGGTQRHSETSENPPKMGVIYKAAAGSLNPRQEQRESM